MAWQFYSVGRDWKAGTRVHVRHVHSSTVHKSQKAETRLPEVQCLETTRQCKGHKFNPWSRKVLEVGNTPRGNKALSRND